MGVSANLGTKVNRRKRAVRLSPNVVEDVSPKQGNEGDGVVVKIDDTGDKAKEILFYKLFGWYPELLSAVVDDLVLMGVSVDSKGTGRGMEKVREEICYRYLCEKRYSRCGLIRFGGRRWDSGDRGFDDGRWEGGGQDVLKDNVLSKIVSKVLVDEGVLGGRGEEVLFLVFTISRLVG